MVSEKTQTETFKLRKTCSVTLKRLCEKDLRKLGVLLSSDATNSAVSTDRESLDSNIIKKDSDTNNADEELGQIKKMFLQR